MSALPSTTAFDEYLNEQLINCLNVQTNVIQNLAQYSQHISLQLIEIKNNVNLLANRVTNLQQQQFFMQTLPPPPPPSNPLFPFPPAWQLSSALNRPPTEPPINSELFSFSTAPVDAQPSRAAPFVFGPISSNDVDHRVEDDQSPIEVKIGGEEDENILFCERAKLYHFDHSINQMNERGTGEMKILQHKTTHLCRVLMRREQVLNVCVNHQLTSQLELIPHQGMTHAFIWSAMDFADGEAKEEIFIVKFKSDGKARRFARIFNESSKENTSDLPSIGRISLNDDDVIPLGQLEPTMEQIERARKLQLPSTFYLYETKTPCKGCRGCGDDPSSNESQSSNRINSHFPSGFFPNSSHPTWLSEGVDSFPSPPKDYRMIIKAKRSLPSNRLPPPSVPTYEQTSPELSQGEETTAAQANQKKSRNFSGHHHHPASNPVDNYATKMATTILVEVKQELHKQGPIVTIEDDNSKSSNSSHTGFSFTNFGTTTDFQFTFGTTPKLSFSDFFKPPSPPASEQTEKRIFPGHGSSIFGDHTNDDDSYEPSNTFKPIVHLLPVEVKTGEEEENILFCERAKLYRFDPSTKQMKERGIGEMKILQHKTTHLCRVLMRREQVLKVCANHRITPQLELKSHQEKEHAFIWSALDFADGQANHETLCVKFKTSDIAKRFFQQFNDAKNVK